MTPFMLTMMTFSVSNALMEQAKKRGKLPQWCYSRKEMGELEERQRQEREIAMRRPEGMQTTLGVRDFLQDIKDANCPARHRFAAPAEPKTVP